MILPLYIKPCVHLLAVSLLISCSAGTSDYIDINFEKALRTGIGIDRLCGDADSPHGAALYWSSSLNVESPSEAYALYLIGFKTIHEILCEYRYYGNGIRPVTE